MIHRCVFESRRGIQGDHFGALFCKCGKMRIYERPLYLQPIPLGYYVGAQK
jgi:hypothetical protein